MATDADFDWASRDRTRIRLAELFHEWRVAWDELQQQRTGGPAAHHDLIDRMVSIEAEVERLLPDRNRPPS